MRHQWRGFDDTRQIDREMAAQCGLSARSLRHLEEKGLICPRRSEAGRRVYGAQEVRLITRVLLLRQTGYRLSEISSAMLQPSLDARSLIETQILHLSAKQRQVTLMLRRLHETLTLLETREAPDVDGLCSLIKEAQNIMSQNDLKTVAKQYFTEDEWERWQEVGSRLFPGEARTRYEQEWATLLERIEKPLLRMLHPVRPKPSCSCRNGWPSSSPWSRPSARSTGIRPPECMARWRSGRPKQPGRRSARKSIASSQRPPVSPVKAEQKGRRVCPASLFHFSRFPHCAQNAHWDCPEWSSGTSVFWKPCPSMR